MVRRNKYGARKVSVDGYTFDSQAEGRRYEELRLLEQAGEIAHLEVHPRFELLAPFVDGQGRKQRGIYYEADFKYFDRDAMHEVAEDVKGRATAVFKLKAKLFLHKYPHLELRIVKA